MIKKLLTLALALAALTGFTACNSDSDSDATDYREVCIDIVTYEGVSSEGSTFTFRKEGDSPLITLTASQSLSSLDFTKGSRILLQYTPHSGQQYLSGAITVLAAANVEGGGAPAETATAEQTRDWASDAVNMSLLMRSGTYLNMQFTAYLGAQTPVVRLVVDEATLDSDYPELHLIYGPYSGLLTKAYYFTGSWDIAFIWERPTCKGINVQYRNAGGVMGGSVNIVKDPEGFVKPDNQLSE